MTTNCPTISAALPSGQAGKPFSPHSISSWAEGFGLFGLIDFHAWEIPARATR